MIRWFISEPSS